ncbi:hypothetical protein niasHS_007785 [Heterodera schachtii]|uniref:Uncharacterized protein n=1 Tax=Heterodera schachtii TaxID=97005 RepID=A0ABD2JPM5_HETSC
MVEANFNNTRRHGIFVQEKRCPCNVNKLAAIKFSKVTFKFIDETCRPCCNITLALCIIGLLCFAVSFVILCFLIDTTFIVLQLAILIMTLFLCLIPISIIISVLCHFNLCCEREHSALEVLYKCDSCSHEVHKCYECFVSAFTTYDGAYHHQLYRGQTYNPWGRYTGNVTKTVLNQQMTITNYEAVEQKFDLMSGVQKDSFNTSWEWMNDLIRRLE